MNSTLFILDIARQTVGIERQALLELEESLGEDFVGAVSYLAQSNGRVVLTGIGKSAIIARKIAATLNSTGTPALFMHAADAVHGDLGMLATNDVLICLSKSGETAEIQVLLPLVQQFGNKIIAICANPNSFLAQRADFFLHTPIKKEADPNNLAPTASTTAQIAMGDALAISLLALKGFTPEDFSRFHPGGSLGKQLYLKVADFYPKNECPHVQVHDDLRNIVLSMTSGRLGITVVVNEEHQPIGVITDGDLRRMLTREQPWAALRADDLMNSVPQTIQADALAVQALNQMREQSISQLVAIDKKGAYVGIVHLHDLVREGII